MLRLHENTTKSNVAEMNREVKNVSEKLIPFGYNIKKVKDEDTIRVVINSETTGG